MREEGEGGRGLLLLVAITNDLIKQVERHAAGHPKGTGLQRDLWCIS